MEDVVLTKFNTTTTISMPNETKQRFPLLTQKGF